jgi:hypothetical protein
MTQYKSCHAPKSFYSVPLERTLVTGSARNPAINVPIVTTEPTELLKPSETIGKKGWEASLETD